jgi:hypothetical protein
VSDPGGAKQRTCSRSQTQIGFLTDDYLERLQGKAWIVSGPFLVLLMLIYNARERITTEFLIARGFDEDIAQRIVSALDKNQAK